MTPVEVLSEARRLGIVLTPKGEQLRVEAPKGVLTPDMREALVEHKAEILASVRRRVELIDLPWPIGYGGLPADQVLRAETTNDRLGVKDPVARRLNVLSWMRCHYRNLGDMDMAEQMRKTYHELRHADPSIKALCGLCEHRGE